MPHSESSQPAKLSARSESFFQKHHIDASVAYNLDHPHCTCKPIAQGVKFVDPNCPIEHKRVITPARLVPRVA